MLDVSILIVSWNVSALLAQCLESVIAAPVSLDESQPNSLQAEIIVVDSASADNTVQMLCQRFPQVRLIVQSENVGFTRSNNIALKEARGRYLLLLNPDTQIAADAITNMVAYLDQHPAVGIVGPHTLNDDGSTQSTRRRFPNFWIGLFESTWLQPYAPKSLLNYYYVTDGTAPHETMEVDWVQGSALMFRRQVYDQIGGMDEGFMMYSEELDWCKRAKLAGWLVVYVGKAQIVHFGGKSSEQAPALTHIRFQCSKLRYYRKYHGRAKAEILRFALLANYAAQYLIEGAKRVLGHKPALRAERMQVYATVLRSGLKVS